MEKGLLKLFLITAMGHVYTFAIDPPLEPGSGGSGSGQMLRIGYTFMLVTPTGAPSTRKLKND
ncbi:MAG: hypothetical protein ISS35_07880 [Kiritimatiellae bacterium]|nr:hypothetical protein [Kiritimatiellia bacterium]